MNQLPPPIPGLWLDPEKHVAYSVMAAMIDARSLFAGLPDEMMRVATIAILPMHGWPTGIGSSWKGQCSFHKDEDLAEVLARNAPVLMQKAALDLGFKWALTPGATTPLAQLEAVAHDSTQQDDVRKLALKIWMKHKLL